MFNETLTTAAIDVDLPHYGTAEYPQTPQEMDTCWPADVMLQRRHAGDEMCSCTVRTAGITSLGTAVSDLATCESAELRHTRSASLRRSSFLRSLGSSNFLRSRIAFGVTSTSSSSAIYASAFSSVICIGGISRTASSLAWVRILVGFCPWSTFTSRSLPRVCSPTIIPR